MSLLEKRIRFSRNVALLTGYVNALRYDWILDQCRRSKLDAEWNAAHCRVQMDDGRCEREVFDPYHLVPNKGTHKFRPIGILKSTHRSALAIDLYLIADGAIQNNRAPYATLGEYWKGLDPDACWGGDFEGFADLGHFSFEYQGVK